MTSSLDVGLGDGDDMVKASGKQTQTTTFATHPEPAINPPVWKVTGVLPLELISAGFRELNATYLNFPGVVSPSAIAGFCRSLFNKSVYMRASRCRTESRIIANEYPRSGH